MNKYLSPLATLIPHPQDTKDRTKPTPYGLMVHTTGRGLLDKAKKDRKSPLVTAIGLYTARKGYGPHYVIDQDGSLVQIASERERMGHAGVSAEERRLYLSGEWQEKVSPRTAIRWTERWVFGVHELQDIKSPCHLYPTRSPNDSYIGVELIPNRKARFSDYQYEVLAALVEDIEKRHDLDLHDRGSAAYSTSSYLPAPCLLGHEDVEPLTRTNRTGGWDPGSLRANPRFDWRRLER